MRVLLLIMALLLAALPADAWQWPWGRNDPWPSSSAFPVLALPHPTVESVFDRRADEGTEGAYRFVAFGDQRALADGEWQEMIAAIAELERDTGEIAFIVDTGDIVSNGKHSDQFKLLAEILAPVDHIPYLVGLGNHELDSNRHRQAREHVSLFLRSIPVSPERMFYRKDLGPATFLFLDTNDWIYGEAGERKSCPRDVDPGTRGGEQIRWLRDQLEISEEDHSLVIAVMHHPLLQSSEKHCPAARSLWNFHTDGQPLIDLLVDGGVDVILTGHTHTYERFRLTRDDGREIVLVNVSGRPRDSFLWIGAGDRRARNIRGNEDAFFQENGWEGLDSWTIVQEDMMPKKGEANQFALITVEPDGTLYSEIHFVDKDGETRRSDRVRLH